MKVYIVVVDYNYDGFSPPQEAFSRKVDAERYVKNMQQSSIYPYEIYDLDLIGGASSDEPLDEHMHSNDEKRYDIK